MNSRSGATATGGGKAIVIGAVRACAVAPSAPWAVTSAARRARSSSWCVAENFKVRSGARLTRAARGQVIVIGAMFFCGTFSVTSNSRMMYAFARDGAIPGHKFFHKVDPKSKSPTRTGAWLRVGCSRGWLTGCDSVARVHAELHSRAT